MDIGDVARVLDIYVGLGNHLFNDGRRTQSSFDT